MDYIHEIAALSPSALISIGDILIKDVAGTRIAVVAAKSTARKLRQSHGRPHRYGEI